MIDPELHKGPDGDDVPYTIPLNVNIRLASSAFAEVEDQPHRVYPLALARPNQPFA